jgi:hypothetical protein
MTIEDHEGDHRTTRIKSCLIARKLDEKLKAEGIQQPAVTHHTSDQQPVKSNQVSACRGLLCVSLRMWTRHCLFCFALLLKAHAYPSFLSANRDSQGSHFQSCRAWFAMTHSASSRESIPTAMPLLRFLLPSPTLLFSSKK